MLVHSLQTHICRLFKNNGSLCDPALESTYGREAFLLEALHRAMTTDSPNVGEQRIMMSGGSDMKDWKSEKRVKQDQIDRKDEHTSAGSCPMSRFTY